MKVFGMMAIFAIAMSSAALAKASMPEFVPRSVTGSEPAIECEINVRPITDGPSMNFEQGPLLRLSTSEGAITYRGFVLKGEISQICAPSGPCSGAYNMKLSIERDGFASHLFSPLPARGEVLPYLAVSLDTKIQSGGRDVRVNARANCRTVVSN